MSEAVPSTTIVSVPLETAVACAAGAAARTVRVLPVRASVSIRAMATRRVQGRRMAPEQVVDSLTSDLLLFIYELNDGRCVRIPRSGPPRRHGHDRDVGALLLPVCLTVSYATV